MIEPAQRAAIAALDNEELLLDRVSRLATLRDHVWQALLDQGWSVPRPQGNFVWLATGEQTAGAAEVFLVHGIVVRALGDDGVRVTIAEPQSVDKLLTASAEVVRTLRTVPRPAGLDWNLASAVDHRHVSTSQSTT